MTAHTNPRVIPMRRLCLLLSIVLSAATSAVRAEVKQASSDNFLIVHASVVKAPPAKVYAALSEIGRWWSSEHSYSGDAANLTLKAEAGACFCERWKDSSVEHGRVVMALPDKLLRLSSALGPLQSRAVTGVLTFQIKPQEGGSSLEVSYLVNGASSSALDKSAPAVDGVLAEAVSRLVRYVETGNPAPAAK
jgi:uncharacterized protein YndB with AHSA1/START domain